MRYCTLADLQLAIPARTLIDLSNDAASSGFSQAVPADINQAVVEESVRQAEELVDAHLRGRYVLPLDPVPSVIKDMAVNLARHWLYARRPEGAELPDAVTRTYKGALDLLASIRDGKLTIGTPTGEVQPEPGEMKVISRRRSFGAVLLDRY
jgi:phage gp36-like protein